MTLLKDNKICHSIIEELPYPILLINEKLNILWGNEKAYLIFNIGKINENLGYTLNCIYSIKEKKCIDLSVCLKCSLLKSISDTFKYSTPINNFEGKLNLKDNNASKTVYISISTRLINIDGDKYVLAVLEDITQLKEMESFFNEINKSLMDLDKLKSSFVANVSHEFKSPLTIIISSAELLKSGIIGKLTKKQDDIVGDIKNTSFRLSRLVKDLLDISAIEAGKIKLNKQDISIHPFLKRICSLFRKQLKDKNLKIMPSFDKKIKKINLDQDKIEEVLINLIDNAIKYSNPGTKVKINLKKNKNQALFEIMNSSKIISNEDILKIFDKFERIKETRREGSGLGLAIAKDIVQLHDGQIWVESKKDSGTKFSFLLPIS